jgi:hypothetical protein
METYLIKKTDEMTYKNSNIENQLRVLHNFYFKVKYLEELRLTNILNPKLTYKEYLDEIKILVNEVDSQLFSF